MKTTLIYSVNADTGTSSSMRLDQYIALHLPKCTRTRAQTLIETGAVHINNYPSTKSNKTVRKGDVITIFAPQDTGRRPAIDKYSQFFTDTLIFEHEHFLVINKPAGITVHAPSSRTAETVVADFAVAYHPPIAAVGELTRPGIVHRLDKQTSGLLLIAKTTIGYDKFRALFAERRIKKSYLAIVAGRPPHAGVVCSPIIRDPFDPRRMACADNTGRPSRTTYRTLTYYDTCTLIEVQPLTGRTHQIRVHMAHAGFPILGDPIYGKSHKRLERHALHATSLVFTFKDEDFSFHAPLPADLVEFLKTCNPADSSGDVKSES